jgi:hypothetical protein
MAVILILHRQMVKNKRGLAKVNLGQTPLRPPSPREGSCEESGLTTGNYREEEPVISGMESNSLITRSLIAEPGS